MNPGLHKRALSLRVGTVCAAIAEMIRSSEFLLGATELNELRSRNDELINGWLYCYSYYSAESAVRLVLLRRGFVNENPRIREQACDIVGDNSLTALCFELEKLFTDAVPYVSESARYNHAMLKNA